MICPLPPDPDPRYPVAQGFGGCEPAAWDDNWAEATTAITLLRIGGWRDALAPGCPVDTPAWDRAEALVNAAYLMHSRQGLRDALDAYEAHARQAFEMWACREAA